MKMIQSINFKQTTIDLLQHLNILSSVKYCESGLEHAEYYEDCVPCPDDGICSNGQFLHCTGDKILIDGKCKFDENMIESLMNDMDKQSVSLLSSLHGQYQCQDCYLYKYMMGITDNNTIKDYRLREKKLSVELSKLLQVDDGSQLYRQTFGSFVGKIRERAKQEIIELPDLAFKKLDGDYYYYSNKPTKPLMCHLSEFVEHHCIIISLIVFIGSFVSYFWIKRQRRKNRKMKQKKWISDRKEDVISALKSYLNESNQKWIPIDVLKQRIIGHTNLCNEWIKVEREVDRDANVQRAVKMIDGIQKQCWKLSETALIS